MHPSVQRDHMISRGLSSESNPCRHTFLHQIFFNRKRIYLFICPHSYLFSSVLRKNIQYLDTFLRIYKNLQRHNFQRLLQSAMIFWKGKSNAWLISYTHFLHPMATCSLSRANLFLEQSVTGGDFSPRKEYISRSVDSCRKRQLARKILAYVGSVEDNTCTIAPRRNWMNMHSIHKNHSGFVACRRRKAQLTSPTSKSRRVVWGFGVTRLRMRKGHD